MSQFYLIWQSAPSMRSESFGVFDDKGREIGARASLFEVSFRPAKDENMTYSGKGIGPGLRWRVWTHATRGGRDFGALARNFENHFETEAEAEAYVEEYLGKAKARALKKWGKS